MELVKIRNGSPTTTSRLIAYRFDKLHKNIVRAIENLECSKDFNRLNFELIYYKDSVNRKQREYILTKDGFVFLVMGFTGKQAATFKEEYINAFNRMELTLKQGIQPMSELKMLQVIINRAVAQEESIHQIEDRLLKVEAQLTTSPDWLTISGYARLVKVYMNTYQCATLGRKLAPICKDRNIQRERTPDKRHGLVWSYPKSLLEEFFPNPQKQSI